MGIRSAPMKVSAAPLLCDRMASLHNPRQPDREGRATARLALDRDVAAHHLAEPLADREAKARAAVFARRGGGTACENSWNSLPICSGVMPIPVSATACVTQSRPFSCPWSSVDGDGAVLGELVGVAHQVEQRLPQAGLVGMQRPDGQLSQSTATRLPFFVAIGSMVLTTSAISGASGNVSR